ncbi:MAG: hypothetical protein HYU67_04425 [Flavobacteriia bacterium]|nr:hypothetical protein [Flavobacteriia bacterium]
MGILKTLKNILFKKKVKKARDFIEIFKTYDKEEANSIKKLLEKYKIPVYEISKMRSLNENDVVFLLRIPKNFELQAKEILLNNE